MKRAPRAKRRLEGLLSFLRVCVNAPRGRTTRPCERCFRVGATDAFRNAHDALGAPRMHRSDAGDAHTCDGSQIFTLLADFGKQMYILLSM